MYATCNFIQPIFVFFIIVIICKGRVREYSFFASVAPS